MRKNASQNNSSKTQKLVVPCTMDRASYGVYQEIGKFIDESHGSFRECITKGQDRVVFFSSSERALKLKSDFREPENVAIIPLCIVKSQIQCKGRPKSIKLDTKTANQIQNLLPVAVALFDDIAIDNVSEREYAALVQRVYNAMILGCAMNLATPTVWKGGNLDNIRCRESVYGSFYNIVIVDEMNVRVLGYDWIIPFNDARLIVSPEIHLKTNLRDLDLVWPILVDVPLINSIDLDHSIIDLCPSRVYDVDDQDIER